MEHTFCRYVQGLGKNRNAVGALTCLYAGKSSRSEGLREKVGSSKRSEGRPSEPVLDREMMATQALELVIDRGLDSLTRTQLSKKLGVAASALYNHVDNKADLVLLIQDALVSQVSLKGMLGLIDGEVTLTDALEDWARSYRAVFANYPSLIPMIAITPVSD